MNCWSRDEEERRGKGGEKFIQEISQHLYEVNYKKKSKEKKRFIKKQPATTGLLTVLLHRTPCQTL